MKTTVVFYTANFNESNVAFDNAALRRILSATALSPSLELQKPCAFGNGFQISTSDYDIYKTATYLKIENVDGDKKTTRYAFLSSFTNLYNNVYEVTYVLDDWANYIINKTEFDARLSGTVAQGSLTLLLPNSTTVNYERALGAYRDVMTTDRISYVEDRLQNYVYGQPLAQDWKCALIYYSKAYLNGKEDIYRSSNIEVLTARGKGLYSADFETIAETTQSFIGFQIIKESTNKTAEIVLKIRQGDQVVETTYAEAVFDPTALAIEKIVYLPFIPFQNTNICSVDYSTTTNKYVIKGNQLDLLGDYTELLDVTPSQTSESQAKCYSVQLRKMSTERYIDGENVNPGIIYQRSANPPRVYEDYQDYLQNSRYYSCPSFSQVEFDFYGAKITTDAYTIHDKTRFIYGFSPDLETAYIHMLNAVTPQSDYQISNMDNPCQDIPPTAIDWQTYTSTRSMLTTKMITSGISGALSTVSAAIKMQPLTATAKAVNTAGNVVETAIKRETVRGVDINPSSNQSTFANIKYHKTLIKNLRRPSPQAALELVQKAELYGIETVYEINDYLKNERLEKYNFIKCDNIEIFGIPRDVARRLEDALTAGITLWSDGTVGDKRVINWLKPEA